MYLDSDFFQVALKVKKQHLEQLKRNISEIRVFEEWNVSIAEYEENFDTAIDSLKKASLDKLHNNTLEKLRVQVKELMAEKINSINETFWVDFNKDFIQFSIMCLKPFKESLQVYYKLEEKECNDILDNIEEDLYGVTLKGVEKKQKDISSVAVDKFKEVFWYEESLPRKWQRIEEAKIDELFVSSKKKAERLFSVFSEFRLLKSPLKISKYNKLFIYLYL